MIPSSDPEASQGESPAFMFYSPESGRVSQLKGSSSLKTNYRWDGLLVGYNEISGLRDFEQ